MKIIMALAISLLAITSWSDDKIEDISGEHQLIRRIVVFPMMTEAPYQGPADEAWWSVRAELTKDKRFLLASRSFLQQKDVYQPRTQLKMADAIILGRLLDANALVTMELSDRILTMRAYGGRLGRLLWVKQIQLHPSLAIAEQIEESARLLAKDFISAIPYHGFVYQDPLKGQPVFKEDGRFFSYIEIGEDKKLKVGDSVQFIRLSSESFKPLFQENSRLEVFAEGNIVEMDRFRAKVEVQRAKSVDMIKKAGLVRIPSEYKRLQEQMALRTGIKANLAPEALSLQMDPTKEEEKEDKPLVSALSFIGNLALFLIIAL